MADAPPAEPPNELPAVVADAPPAVPDTPPAELADAPPAVVADAPPAEPLVELPAVLADAPPAVVAVAPPAVVAVAPPAVVAEEPVVVGSCAIAVAMMMSSVLASADVITTENVRAIAESAARGSSPLTERAAVSPRRWHLVPDAARI